MINAPKFSLVTVSYNSEKTILDSINSVLSQTFTDFELIIVDGSSSDKTLEIIKQFEDQRIKLISEPDKGIYDGMNKGLALSNGEIIGFLNSDDMLNSKNTLETIFNNFHVDIDCTFGDVLIVDDLKFKNPRRHYSSANFELDFFKYLIMPPHPSFYFRRRHLNLVKNFDLDFPMSSDFDFVLRCLYKHNLKYRYINEIIVIMSDGGFSNSGFQALIQKNYESIKSLKKNNIKFNPLNLISKFFYRLKEINRAKKYSIKNG